MVKIKVLIVNTAGLNRNGITQMIYDYYSRFDMGKFEVHVLSGEGESQDVRQMFTSAGIKVHTVKARKKKLLAYMGDLLKLCRTQKFNIMHVNGNSATMAIELSIARYQKIPYRIAHVHSSTCDAKKADKILRPVFNRTYTNGYACCELAGKWMYGDGKFSVIKNGRDMRKYAYRPALREEIRNSLEIKAGELAVVHIGNFNEGKNQQFLIRVFNEIHKDTNAKLYLAGYGHCEESLRELVNQLGLQDAVVFMGVINNVEEILQAMDIMILPSLHEGLPLVVIESQLAALPCLISDTITKECAFTELVEFKSLSSGAAEWAKDAVQLNQRNREIDANGIMKKAIDNGYDIDADVKNLMLTFENMVNR